MESNSLLGKMVGWPNDQLLGTNNADPVQGLHPWPFCGDACARIDEANVLTPGLPEGLCGVAGDPAFDRNDVDVQCLLHFFARVSRSSAFV
ncbi:hypothetical protein E3A20_13930 [Planctomyces bekefii]|uniref:Uncharacterized protein n=1 Tax=Planctomyces bekefii TaxID=1653850 RepID=A0A5C6M5T0_9PLAN|nr:hypothetical protein E3A20_13930 [Planctomyces bekefii]